MVWEITEVLASPRSTSSGRSLHNGPVRGAHRLRISEEPFLMIEGTVQNQDRVIHVKARRIEPLTCPGLAAPQSHDFH